MKAQFETIYATNEWQFGSGEGSLPEHTVDYRDLVERFLRDRGIARVLDVGCGDWQSSRLIDWRGVHYTGVDVVAPVIEANRARFGRPGIEFACVDPDLAELPDADLLIAKDVLQHWSTAAVERFIPSLARYRYCLITNCVARAGATVNRDISDGGFRPLDLRMAPFHLRGELLLDYTNQHSLWERIARAPRWRKNVLLVSRG